MDNKEMKILYICALPEERVEMALPGFEVVPSLTGISKPYASANLALAISNVKPDIIINIGTAGTMPGRAEVGDILVCSRFLDRDIMSQDFTSISPEVNPELPDVARAFHSIHFGTACEKHFTVNTGDDFVTADQPIEGDAVDMEAFAEALMAKQFGIPFFAVKYITDVIGQNSMQIWEERLADARRGLTEYLKAVAEKL